MDCESNKKIKKKYFKKLIEYSNESRQVNKFPLN